MTNLSRFPQPRRRFTWRYIFAVATVGTVIVGLFAAARHFWDPESAEAQVPASLAPAPARPPVTRTQIPQAPRTAADPQAKVVAIVNGESIGREQLAQEALRRYGKDVVENLVNKHLILQACQKQSITITPQEVEAEINQMAAKFGLSKDRWLEMLKSERNVNPEQYSNDIIWPTLALRKLAADRLVISEEELSKAWESEFGEQRLVRMIQMSDKAECQQVQRYVAAKPEEFGKVAKDYSQNKPSAAARGLIPPIRKHVGSKEVEQAVFALAEGEVSQVVATEGQFFIFKCDKIHPPEPTNTANQQRAIAELRERIRDDKLRTAAGDLFKQLQDEARVVNIYNNPELKAQMPGVAATVNGQQLTMRQLAEECISRHGVEVLEGEINRVVLQQQLKTAGATVGQEDINAEVARAAETYGFPDVQSWLNKVVEEDGATVELYVQDAVWPTVALKKLVANNVEVTEEDLKKGYEANYGAQVEVLVCVLGNQRRAQEVWEMADGSPDDKFFGDLAYQYSIEPTSKYNYGKVPPIRRYSGQPEIEKEAFRLKPGELSGIVVLGDKYIIMRCLQRTEPASPPSFADVKEELFKDIHEKKLRIAMSERFEEIREAARIENVLAGTSQAGKKPGQAGSPTSVRPASAARPVDLKGAALPSGVRPAGGAN